MSAQIFGVPMTYVIFAGDMLVMAFMIAVVVWVSIRANDEQIAAAASIPLDEPEQRERNGERDAE